MKTKFSFGKFFKDHQYWVWLMLALVFFFGLVGRFYDFDDPPLDFHPTRQLHSMLIARGMFYENYEEAPDWKREMAVGQWLAEGQIEPPVMERLSALGYRLVGEDDLRIPRLLAIFFWTLGGVGLFLLSRDLMGVKGAVVGLAFYMVLPYALYATRSFQPEPLMIAGIIWSWWGATRWARNKTWKNAILAGLLSGIAIYIKSPAVFFVAPALLGAVLVDQKLKQVFRNPRVWVMGLLTILPTLIYTVDGLYLSGFLGSQTSFRFFPELLTDPFHYVRWEEFIDKTVGTELFLIGLFGTALIAYKPHRVMFLGVFMGYLLYGLVFSYHIISHDYYQIPLVPAVAVGISAAASVLINKGKERQTLPLIVLGGVLFFWMSINFWEARMTLKHSQYHDEPKLYAALGEKLTNYSVVSITPDYGYRIAYWGWKPTTNWLSAGDFVMRELAGQDLDQKALFEEAIANGELFLVTDFSEFDRQPLVKEILTENYPVFEQGEGFIIYDLRE